MTASPQSHARHVLSVYSRDVAAPAAVEPGLLEKLIAEEIQKAVREERETLREQMACDPGEPCAIEHVCAHHKALAGAILAAR